MGMFSRICDVISANINELVEKFEDPEKMLKQAVREMEATILRAEQDAVRVLASEKLLSKELLHNEQQATEWQQRAEQAVTGSHDELARRAIRRKQEHEKLIVALKSQLVESQQTSQTLRQQLDAMRVKLAEAKRSLTTLAARKRLTEHQYSLNSMTTNQDSESFAKFARLKEKVEQAEAEAQALVEIRQDTLLLSAPDAAGSSDVDLELAALKSRLAVKL